MEREARLPVFIDYKSPCVIQCVGQLATLAQDRVVHSIGRCILYTVCGTAGNTNTGKGGPFHW